MSLRLGSLIVTAALIFLPGHGQQPDAKSDPADPQIEQAMGLLKDKKVDEAMTQLDAALKINPNSTVAHVLRGSILAQKADWAKAETEFTAAERTAPNDVRIQLFLADAKFSEKHYVQARALYVKLERDPDRGDYAAFQVFLCDLAGGNIEAASKELDLFNDAMGNPSYYFANFAWRMARGDMKSARPWLNSAGRIYPLPKATPYAQALRVVGYLPIPETDN